MTDPMASAVRVWGGRESHCEVIFNLCLPGRLAYHCADVLVTADRQVLPVHLDSGYFPTYEIIV